MAKNPFTDSKGGKGASAIPDPLEAAKLPPPAPAVPAAPPPATAPPAPVGPPTPESPKVVHLPTKEEYVEAGYAAEEYPKFIEKRSAEAQANGQAVQIGDAPPTPPAALSKAAPKRYRVKARTTVSLNGQMTVLPADSEVSLAHYGPDFEKILAAKVPLEEIK